MGPDTRSRGQLMDKPNCIRLFLRISPDDYMAYYRGGIKHVVARARDGRVVKFPASALRRFISRDGIEGEFEIEFGPDSRLKNIRRVR
jgi:hypothetical protein